MQQTRRSNPYPWMWEIPVAVILGVILLLFLGVHLGRAVANLFAGAGMTVAPSAQLVPSWLAILGGDAAAGLSPRPADVASPGALLTWIVLVETGIIAGLVWIGRLAWHEWGPDAVRGVASRREVEDLIGHRRLRKVAPIVRPDLHDEDPR